MAKRKPDKQLTHENWDEEDVPEDFGSYQKAPDHSLKERVIRRARRRITPVETDSGALKAIFAGFSGFRTQPSESKKFSFGTNVAAATAAAGGIDNQPSFKLSFTPGAVGGSDISDLKSCDEKGSFISAADEKENTLTSTNVPFSATLLQPAAATAATTKTPDKMTAHANKLNELSMELRKTSGSSAASAKDDDSSKTPDEVFLQKLRSLNLLCAEWIIKHLNENLSYILSPIFDDYQKYLSKLTDERQRSKLSSKKARLETVPSEKPAGVSFSTATSFETCASSLARLPSFKAPDFKSSLTKFNPLTSVSSGEEQPKNSFAFPEPPSSHSSGSGPVSFKFPGSSSSNNGSSKNSLVTRVEIESQEGKGDGGSSGLFKFNASPKGGETVKSEPVLSSSSPFALGGSFTPMGNSFLGLKSATTFGFSAAAAAAATESAAPTSKDDDTKADQDEAPPPPVFDEDITEEGAIYQKKCKVFIKKDGAFVDHGVGFLFLKLVGDENKCQLIVRANNKLATLILNVLLTANVPVQQMGTNNVMLVCCPMPDAKPSSVLLKVKTSKDAEELLNTLNEHKK